MDSADMNRHNGAQRRRNIRKTGEEYIEEKDRREGI